MVCKEDWLLLFFFFYFVWCRKMRSPQARIRKPRTRPPIPAKVRLRFDIWFHLIWNSIIFIERGVSLAADGLAYSALLKNELLGAGIEKVQDPQTEDRRLQPSTPEKRSLFSVSVSCPPAIVWFQTWASKGYRRAVGADQINISGLLNVPKWR